MDRDDTAWGLVGALAIAVLSGVILLGAKRSQGAPVTGRITAMGLQETKTGSYPVAVVDLGGKRTASVPLAREDECRVGDTIALLRYGAGQLAPAAAPCRRTSQP